MILVVDDNDGGKIMKKIRKDNRGFSLIELIVVILIMAIISGAAVIALGSIFSTKTKAAAQSVQDALKQARVDAITRDNDIVPLDSGETAADNGFATNVYVKFYISNSELFADVCTDKSGSEVVLNSKVVASDKYNLQFCNKSGNLIDSDASVGSTTVKVYFKKTTGGVSRVAVDDVCYANCDMIKVKSPSGETLDVIMVSLTGRSYIDY